MRGQLDLEIPPAPSQEKTAALRSLHLQAQPVPVGEALSREKKARAQEAAVLRFFEQHPGERFTPSAVWHLFTASHTWRGVPLTSIRRCLSDLTKRGRLEHHARDRRPGPLGAKESTWSLAERRS